VDLDCAYLHMLCNVNDGGCVLPPHPCDPNRSEMGGSQCNGTGVPNCTNPNDSTNFCFCRPDHTSDAGGYCYPQLKPCAPCTSDTDCGVANSGVDNVGVCTTLDSPNGGNVCLRYEVGGDCNGPTGGGFVPGRQVDGGTVCECVNMTCPCGPCMTDADCPQPALGVCDRTLNTCQAPCLPGLNQCPTVGGVQQHCHVMDKFLDPTIPLEYYGGGRCGPPCNTDMDCQSNYYTTPGGVPLRCEPNTQTCRPPLGWCIADFECNGAPHPDASVTPFCDVWADGGASCNGADCRLGTNTHDMTNLVPFTDCNATYVCLLLDGGPPTSLPDASQQYGYGVCELEPCYTIGPTFQYGCAQNQFCCGSGDAGAQNLPCTLGQCYCAPNPPWCTSCGSNTDCAGLTGFVPGPTICTKTFAGPNHCALSCDNQQPWTCPAGSTCTSEGFPDNMSCPTGTTPVTIVLTTGPTYGCQCPTGKCPTPPLAGVVPLDVNNCSKCPDPSTNGCLTDNSNPDGAYACVCPADGGGDSACHTIPGSSSSTVCSNVGGTSVCGAGVPMIWDVKQGCYVISQNCIIRDCKAMGGSIDAGC
jgi:hypothetical protein